MREMRSKLKEKRLCKEKKTEQRNKATVIFNELREDIASVNHEQDFYHKGTMRKHNRDLGY